MTLSKIDSLRFAYTYQRHIRKKPTVAVWEKLNDAVNEDLEYAARVNRNRAALMRRKQAELAV
jgi:hypothetical protein